ncbi:acyltransferase [Clostridium drakei]|uniref:Acyltransferase n=1 Tax=Clostridium drakei TaxID=332101 RepID=A0A2U8DUB6_9CLOT|nr:acyltransferase [Clostridium drakei]AWI06220.1 acyltransferase [Clostridium drakei]
MKNDRLKELDVLRAFAFIFVVEQHTMGGYFNIKGISYFYYEIFKFMYTLAKPAVATFLCISGIVISYSSIKKFVIKKYYIKKAVYIFIPYVLWSIVYMHYFKKNINIPDLCMQVLSGDAGYHLWYMGMAVRLFIYLPLILWILKKVHVQNFILRFFVFVSITLSYYEVSKYENVISDKVIHFIFNNPTAVQMKIINISPFFWFLYFVMGIYIALNYEVFKRTVLKFKVLIIIIYIGLFTYAYLDEMNMVPFVRSIYLLYFVFSILAWYIISVMLSNRAVIYSIFNFFGKYSFGSYLSHVLLIQSILKIIMFKYGIRDWLAVGTVLWISSCIVNTILIKAISHIPYGYFITGNKEKSYIEMIKSINIKRVVQTVKSSF